MPMDARGGGRGRVGGCNAIRFHGGGGFARVDIPISRGMGPWVVNPLPLTACLFPFLDWVLLAPDSVFVVLIYL